MAREALTLVVIVLVSIGLGYALAIITMKPNEPLILQPRNAIAIDTVYRTHTRIRYIHDTVYAEVVDTIYYHDTLRIPLTLYRWLYRDKYVTVRLRTVYLDSFSYKLNYLPSRPKNWMLGLALDNHSYLWLLCGYKHALIGVGHHDTHYRYMLGLRWTF